MMQLTQPAAQRGAGLIRCGDPVIDGWNIMNGIDWQALPIVCEMLGIRDVEGFVQELLAIRKYQETISENGDA